MNVGHIITRGCEGHEPEGMVFFDVLTRKETIAKMKGVVESQSENTRERLG